MTRRIWASLALGVALVAAPAMATVVTDKTWELSLTTPDGWIAKPTPGTKSVFILRPTDEKSEANCVVSASRSEETKSANQQQVNEAFKAPFGRDFWKEVHADDRDVLIEHQNARLHPSGMMSQEAVVAFIDPQNSAQGRIKLMTTLLFAPGYLYGIGCGSLESQFESYRTVFRQIEDSVRRTGGAEGFVNALPAPAVSEAKLETPAAGPLAGAMQPALMDLARTLKK
ncbi:MAG TPA: hypothetical protein DCL48_06610 [Alphaproteobacteria bacterium]|nr:hypothetical protein [Alphaproteobacteria bacterium]